MVYEYLDMLYTWGVRTKQGLMRALVNDYSREIKRPISQETAEKIVARWMGMRGMVAG